MPWNAFEEDLVGKLYKVEKVVLISDGRVDRRLKGEKAWLLLYWCMRELVMVEKGSQMGKRSSAWKS